MIRTIQEEDNESCAAMIRRVFEEFGAQTKGTVYEDPTTDALFELFDRSDAELFVIVDEEEVKGSCGIYPTEGLPNGMAELVKYYISKEYRGKGYGRQLMQLCEMEAIRLGYNQLYIESTFDFIDAVRIYEKIGYSRLDKPIGNSGHEGCPIWMLKPL